MIGSVSQMKNNGWIFDFDFDGSSNMNDGKKGLYSDAAKQCGEDANWYGWSSGRDVGSLKTTLIGSGEFTLDFGNCGSKGNVEAYLDDQRFAWASPGKNFVKIQRFAPGSVLKIKDKGADSIVRLNAFSVICTSMLTL